MITFKHRNKEIVMPSLTVLSIDKLSQQCGKNLFKPEPWTFPEALRAIYLLTSDQLDCKSSDEFLDSFTSLEDAKAAVDAFAKAIESFMEPPTKGAETDQQGKQS